MEEVVTAGKYVVAEMTEILAALDGAKEESGERKNRDKILQATTIVLDIMKKMGAEEIRTEKGDRFDEKKHRIVERKILKLADNTIVKVVSRGFTFGDEVLPAWVIVAQNPGVAEAGKKEAKKKEKFSIRDYGQYRQYVRKCFSR